MTFADLTYEHLRDLKSSAYVYSKSRLLEQIQKLRQGLPEKVKIFYSLKANAHPRILSIFQKATLGADVASSNELEAALKAGFPAEMIEFTGPGKSYETLRTAVENRVRFLVVESVGELHTVEQVASDLHTNISVCLRIHPSYYHSPQGREIRGQSSQFGIDEEKVSLFFDELKKCSRVSLQGFHIYTQSQILDPSILLKNFTAAYESVVRCAEIGQRPLQTINLGGGFGVDYYEGQQGLHLDPLRKGFEELAEKVADHQLLEKAQVYVETGRFLTAPAGVYIARVQYLKESRGTKIAILDGGFSQNMAVCGVGQLLRKNYKIKVISQRPSVVSEKITLAGPSCYSLDILASDVVLPLLECGDFVVFENCGSYGPSFSPQNFLGLPPAQEIFLEDL